MDKPKESGWLYNLRCIYSGLWWCASAILACAVMLLLAPGGLAGVLCLFLMFTICPHSVSVFVKELKDD